MSEKTDDAIKDIEHDNEGGLFGIGSHRGLVHEMNLENPGLHQHDLFYNADSADPQKAQKTQQQLEASIDKITSKIDGVKDLPPYVPGQLQGDEPVVHDKSGHTLTPMYAALTRAENDMDMADYTMRTSGDEAQAKMYMAAAKAHFAEAKGAIPDEMHGEQNQYQADMARQQAALHAAQQADISNHAANLVAGEGPAAPSLPAPTQQAAPTQAPSNNGYPDPEGAPFNSTASTPPANAICTKDADGHYVPVHADQLPNSGIVYVSDGNGGHVPFRQGGANHPISADANGILTMDPSKQAGPNDLHANPGDTFQVFAGNNRDNIANLAPHSAQSQAPEGPPAGALYTMSGGQPVLVMADAQPSGPVFTLNAQGGVGTYFAGLEAGISVGAVGGVVVVGGPYPGQVDYVSFGPREGHTFHEFRETNITIINNYNEGRAHAAHDGHEKETDQHSSPATKTRAQRQDVPAGVDSKHADAIREAAIQAHSAGATYSTPQEENHVPTAHHAHAAPDAHRAQGSGHGHR